MKIREFKKEDVGEMYKLFYNTVHGVNKSDYTKKQLEVWAPKVKDLSEWREKFLSTRTYIMEDHDKVVGFANIDKTGYLDMMYVHADYQGRGVGSKLMKNIVAYIDKHSIKKINANVSITAVPFF